jgi:hypothetical protein
MCRAFALMRKAGSKITETEQFSVFASLFYNSYAAGNRDGYAVVADGRTIIRTLDASVAFAELFKHRAEIGNAGIVIGHARMATHGEVSERYIHLWDMQGYFCCHNGVVNTTGLALNDSLDFFKSVNRLGEPEDWKAALEKRTGTGVFMAASANELVVAAYGKDATIAVGKDVVVVVSQSDILKQVKRILIPDTEKVLRWGMLEYGRIETKRTAKLAKVTQGFVQSQLEDAVIKATTEQGVTSVVELSRPKYWTSAAASTPTQITDWQSDSERLEGESASYGEQGEDWKKLTTEDVM